MALAALILASCAAPAPPQPVQSALSSAVVTAESPTSLPVATSTVPSNTATASPTPGARLLIDDSLQAGVARIASGFIGTGRNPALSVGLVRRDPQTGELAAMLLNFGTTAKDGGQPVDLNAVAVKP